MVITIWLLFVLPRVLSEFTSLSCGSQPRTEFRDKVTNISYTSDTDYISTGDGFKIKTSYQKEKEQKNWYLRSFPRGLRNCYTFNLTSGERYLIRTTFLHGGYDNDFSRRFELHLGANRWTTVSTSSERKEIYFEMIHLLTTDRLQVCLVKTGNSTPFISSLELRKLHSKAYVTPPTFTGSLQTLLRADVGSISNKSLRYRADLYGGDLYDRIWIPYHSKNWSQFSTKKSVAVKSSQYKPPVAAMITASSPTDPYAPMEISLPGVDRATELYVYLHFSEIQDLSSKDIREIDVMYNGRLIESSCRPPTLYTHTYKMDDEIGPDENGMYKISLQRTVKSTLPPLLNAFEVYAVNSFAQKETVSKDVDAITKIKWEYGVNKIDWEGDPCVPQKYMWNGVNCSYKQNKAPRIIYLNLTASGLTGEILKSILNLTNLEVLDLSNNSLTGSIPDFLGRMESLKLINLSNNGLNNSIPRRLLDKAKRGSVTLSVDGFPEQCSSAPCSTTSKKKKNKVVASVAATICFILILTAAIVILILKRRQRKAANRDPSSDTDNLQQQNAQSNFKDVAHNVFTYEDLSLATDNFAGNNLIGEGGFGLVHRGVLPHGTEVAIKQLKAGSRQGEREFLAEIEVISRVHHRHLVSLVGYCVTGTQRLLVDDFVPNKTLEYHLHEKKAPVMEWAKRIKIALGSAKGLSYLHDDCNPRTIHRDVKAANILIDNNFEPKLADFGLARSCSDKETHVSTRIMGTFGYMSPEYASSGKLTEKADVYAFGVVLLELITGRRPVQIPNLFSDDDSTVDWANSLMLKALNKSNFDSFVDPQLENDFDVIEMTRVATCAAASVRHSAKRRPTMSQIVRALEGNMTLDELTQGVSTEHITDHVLDGSSDYCSTQYTEHLKEIKKMAFESQTFGSSTECSRLSNENGQNPSGSSSISQGQRKAQEIVPDENTDKFREEET